MFRQPDKIIRYQNRRYRCTEAFVRRKKGRKYFALLKVETINGKSPEEVRDRSFLIT